LSFRTIERNLIRRALPPRMDYKFSPRTSFEMTFSLEKLFGER